MIWQHPNLPLSPFSTTHLIFHIQPLPFRKQVSSFLGLYFLQEAFPRCMSHLHSPWDSYLISSKDPEKGHGEGKLSQSIVSSQGQNGQCMSPEAPTQEGVRPRTPSWPEAYSVMILQGRMWGEPLRINGHVCT